MKRILSVLLVLTLVLSLAACGGKKDGGANVDSPFIGAWTGFGGDMYGMAITADEAAAYTMNIDGSKAVLGMDGESMEAKWTADGNKITITVEEIGIAFDGTLEENIITFEDYMNFGWKLYLVKDGTEVADPSRFIPEADQAMVGTWASYAVTDVLGDAIPEDVMPADAFIITFNSDYTADFALGEEMVVGETWTLSDDFGFLADSEYDISWDVEGDEIVVCYYIDGESFNFNCAKAE